MRTTRDRDRVLLGKLWQLQQEMGWTDAALAKVLGVGQPLITQTRKRQRVGKTLLLAACLAFPKLRALYFGPDVPDGTTPMTDGEAVA